MSAPKKSTRPRSRTRKVEDEAKINSGSTRSIDGLNMSERALTAKQKKLDKNNDGKISGADFKKMKGGGRAKAKGYAVGGKVKAKGMAMGGKIKSKGMAMGGKVMSKGYAMGGKVRSKGEATGGAGFGAARFSGKGTQIF